MEDRRGAADAVRPEEVRHPWAGGGVDRGDGFLGDDGQVVERPGLQGVVDDAPREDEPHPVVGDLARHRAQGDAVGAENEDRPAADRDVAEVGGHRDAGPDREPPGREGDEQARVAPRQPPREETGEREEPFEEVLVDVDEEFSGVVVEKLSMRKGQMQDMRPSGGGKTRITFSAPSRGLIGYHGEFMTDTRGNGVLNRIFHDWAPYKGPIQGRRQGVLISMENGVSVAYALWNLEERGRLFIGAQEQVYQGMIIGEHSRDNDLEVNPLKGKKLTNVRASGTDEAVRLTPHVQMSLEEAIAYIDDDELVEIIRNNFNLKPGVALGDAARAVDAG